MHFYRLVLLLYPSSFRREYGPEMSADFAHRRQESSGALASVLLSHPRTIAITKT